MFHGQGRPDLSGYAKLSDLAAVQALIPASSFVTPDIKTVGEVMSSYPAGSGYRGKYIRVSDLFGATDGVLRCGYDTNSGLYFWQPTTPEYGRSMALTQNITVAPLTHPTAINLTGTIGAAITRTVTLDPTNGRPGATIELRNNLTSILGALNILGTGLGSGLSFALSGYKKFFLDWNGSQLAWVALV